MKKLLLSLTLSLALVTLLHGCTAESKELRTMLETEVANASLTTGREVDRSYQDKGVTLGKPIPAEVRIKYEPKDQYTKNDVYDEIVEILNEGNWETEKLSIEQTGFFRASLSQVDFTIEASVNAQSDDNTVSLRLRSFPR